MEAGAARRWRSFENWGPEDWEASSLWSFVRFGFVLENWCYIWLCPCEASKIERREWRWWSGSGGGPAAASFGWTIVADGGGGRRGLGKMRWRWVDYRNSTKSWGWIRNSEFSWILCFSSKFWFIKMSTQKKSLLKSYGKSDDRGANWKLKKFGGHSEN